MATATTEYPPFDKGISHRGVEFLVVTIVMTFLASVFVALRFTSRRRATLQADDWACLGALVVAYAFLINTALLVTIGHGGNHMIQFYGDLKKAPVFVQCFLGTDILAAAGLALSKLSVLLFYYRIFSTNNKRFQITIWVLSAIVVAWFISTACGLIFASHPVVGEWKVWVPHTHIKYKAFWISYGAVNMALDIIVLALPQPLVWKLKLSRPRKRQLSGAFLLGGFVCAASLVRIVVIAKLDMGDESYSLLLVGIWNVVEFCTAIICACLPMVPALLREVFGRDTIKGSSTTYPTSGYRKRQQISSDSRTGLSGETAVPSRSERDDIPLVYSKQTRVQEVAAV